MRARKQRTVLVARSPFARRLRGLLLLAAALAGAPPGVLSTAAAEPATPAITLTVVPPSVNERAPVQVEGDTNLPEGSTLLVRLLHLGEPLAADRAKVENKRFSVRLDAGIAFPASWYDVLASWRPEDQVGFLPGEPGAFSPVIAGVSFAVGAPEEARSNREEEVAYAAEALAQARVLFETLRDGLAQRATRSADFRPAGWATDYAGWAERTFELRTQIATRRERRGFGLLPVVEERTLEIFELLCGVHRELSTRSPFAPAETPLAAPAPTPEEVVAALVAHLEPRLVAAERALERERRVGDRAFLVAQLRGLWALRDGLLHTRQPRSPLGSGFGEDLVRGRQEELDRAQSSVTALSGQELSGNYPSSFRALSALPGALAALWDALQRFARGAAGAGRQVAEADEAFRTGFTRIVEEMELRDLFPELGG